jgi:hypothetical protein
LPSGNGKQEITMRSSVHDSSPYWNRNAPSATIDIRTDAEATVTAFLILAGIAALMLSGIGAVICALVFGIWTLWN